MSEDLTLPALRLPAELAAGEARRRASRARRAGIDTARVQRVPVSLLVHGQIQQPLAELREHDHLLVVLPSTATVAGQAKRSCDATVADVERRGPGVKRATAGVAVPA